MSLHLIRALLILMPHFLLCLLATMVFLGEDIKPQWLRILLFCFLAGIISLPNIYMVSFLRMGYNILSVLLLFKFLFQFPWWKSLKFTFVFFFFTISTEILFHLVFSNWFKIQVSPNNPILVLRDNLIPCMISTYLPAIFILLIAYLLRRVLFYYLFFFESLKNNYLKLRPVVISFSFQLIIIVGLWSQIPVLIDIGQSPILGAVNLFAIITLIILNIYTLYKTMQITEASAFQTSGKSISQDIMDLINSVRSQRHDFLNHIQVMVSLLYDDKHVELKEYLIQLSQDVSRLNNILKIDNPFLGALLNAKVTLADIKDIRLDIQVKNSLSIDYSKVVPLVRIIGNLIDNALEAVEIMSVDDRWIKVLIKEEGPVLYIQVTNPGAPSLEVVDHIFVPGYSSKGEKHSGLGLNICKQLTEQLHGQLEYSFDENLGIAFSVMITK